MSKNVECVSDVDFVSGKTVDLSVGFMNGEKCLAIFVGGLEAPIVLSADFVEAALESFPNGSAV